MKFSIIHASARPDKWEDVYLNWLANAADPLAVEYILIVDTRWGFTELPKLRPQDKTMWATGERRSYVDNVNLGALASTGDVLVVNADDQLSCNQWDEFILQRIQTSLLQSADEFVIWCSTGTPKEVERGIIVMPIVSRARYNRLGYIFYPLYESMYADNDLHDHAVKDGCLITAFGPVFPHKHPIVTQKPMDKAYKRQNRREAYHIGEAVWSARMANGYNPLPHNWKPPQALATPINHTSAVNRVPKLAVIMPGERFSFQWVTHWTVLFYELQKYFQVIPQFGYSSNVYVARELLLQAVLKHEPDTDFFLWIDDDNLVTIKHVLQLIEDLNEVPEADAATGWCWSHDGTGLIVSCGHFNDNGTVKRLPYSEMMSAPSPLGWVDWTGFPCILMKASMVIKAGKLPFAPIPVPSHPMGFTGEDISFCKNAFTRGQARILLDRRVEVEHMKEGALGLSPAKASKQSTAVPADLGDEEHSSVAAVR
jgi:hypothetical protein